MAQESGRTQGFRADARPAELAAWLHIDEHGIVTIYTGKVEVGQNARTALTQAVAEQLHADIGSIQLVMGDTDLTPYDMGTFGSRTTPPMAPQLKKVGAAARETLIDLAAEKWTVDRRIHLRLGRQGEELGHRRHPRLWRLDSRAEAHADGGRSRRHIRRSVDHRRHLGPEGQCARHGHRRASLQHRHRAARDVVRPRSSPLRIQCQAGVARYQAGDIHSRPDHRSGFTMATLSASRPPMNSPSQPPSQSWCPSGRPTRSHPNKDLFAYLKTHPAQSRGGGPASPSPEQGSVDQGLESSDHKLAATYTVAYIAHTPLEPRAAVAEWNSGKLTVWTGTQRPFGVKSELAEASSNFPRIMCALSCPIPVQAMAASTPGEVAIEAARIALAAGKPVKVIWTREDEFTWAYFRPAGVIDIRSGATKDGLITAWEFHNYNSGPSGIDTPYEIPNREIEFHPTDSPLRQGSYRGLAATANHFARESHMDEIAAALGMDPLEFRLKNLKDERLRAVLQAAAEKFGWSNTKSEPTRGFGLACGVEKGSYVASCAEVSIAQPDRKVKIERVVTAFECGAIVNPEHLKNQVEGSVVQGIGGALFEAIQFAKNGRILNPHLAANIACRVSAMSRCSKRLLLDRKDLPSAGAGETPIVGLAPAIGNAIYQATSVTVSARCRWCRYATAVPNRQSAFNPTAKA